MFIKKTIIVALLLVMAMVVSACGQTPETTARMDLEHYLQAKKEGDSKTADKYLNADSDLYDVYSYKYVSTLKSDSDMKDGEYFTFLYDMHIATEGGDEIHRKIEFQMYQGDKENPHYTVDKITIRENYDDSSDF